MIVVEFLPPVPTAKVVEEAAVPSKFEVTPEGKPNMVKVTFPALVPDSALTVIFEEFVVTPGNADSKY